MAKPAYVIITATVIGLLLALTIPVFASADYGGPATIHFTAEFDEELESTSVGGSDLTLTLTDEFAQNDDIRLQIRDRVSEESDTYRYAEGETRNITFTEYQNLTVTYDNYNNDLGIYTVVVMAEYETGLINTYGYTIPIILILLLITILVQVMT